MPAPQMLDWMGTEVGFLVLVVLLLVVMPALLYLMGWGVARYTGQKARRRKVVR
jgi:hypothetical protein